MLGISYVPRPPKNRPMVSPAEATKIPPTDPGQDACSMARCHYAAVNQAVWSNPSKWLSQLVCDFDIQDKQKLAAS